MSQKKKEFVLKKKITSVVENKNCSPETHVGGPAVR